MQYLYSVLSSFAIISARKRELVALLLLSSCCHVAVSILCYGVVGLVVAFPDHTYFMGIGSDH